VKGQMENSLWYPSPGPLARATLSRREKDLTEFEIDLPAHVEHRYRCWPIKPLTGI